METNPVKRIADAVEKIAAVQTQLLAIALETRQTKLKMEAQLQKALTQPMKEKE